MPEEQHDINGVLLVTVSEFAGDQWRSIAERIPAPEFPDDPDPFFVTLPVCSVDAESRGDRALRYGRAVNEQIVEQINAKKPEGSWGHIKPDEIATRYDRPDLMAVGALMDEQGVTWVKAYVPPYAAGTRDYYRTKMRLNARAGLSMWGKAWTAQGSNEVVRINLQRIDIADPERVGLEVAAAVPVITANMAGNPADEPTESDEEVNDMGDETRLQEMQTENQDLRQQIAAQQARVSEMATALGVDADAVSEAVKGLQQQAAIVAEMQTALGDVEPGDLVQRVSEMATELGGYRRAARKQRVLTAINHDGDDALVKLPELRPIVIAHMGPEDNWPDTDDGVQAAVEAILDKPEVKNVAEMLRDRTSGGRVVVGKGKPEPTDDEVDDQARDLARSMGIS